MSGFNITYKKHKENNPFNNNDQTPATQDSVDINFMKGNVGIGEDNPSEKFEVLGNLKIKNGALIMGDALNASVKYKITIEEGNITLNTI